MKNSLISFFLFLSVLFFASGVSAQDKDCRLLSGFYPINSTFERKGDVLVRRNETADYKSVSIAASKIIYEKKSQTECEILEMSLTTAFKGSKLMPTDKIGLTFESISKKYLYDAEARRNLILQADGADVFSTTLKQRHRDKISRTIRRENLPSEIDINFATLKKLAEAQNVTIKLGKRVFRLTNAQQQAITDFYRALNVPDKNTA